MFWPGNGFLNQSRNWAVESTWSSCLPLGKTVISWRYSASQDALSGMWTNPFSIIAVCGFGPDDLSAQLFKGDIELLRTESEMRVLVAGAGAIGGYFGGRLLEAGHVPFGVRAGWHLPAPGANRNRKFVDSLLEGNGFELPVRGRGQPDCRLFVQPASVSSRVH